MNTAGEEQEKPPHKCHDKRWLPPGRHPSHHPAGGRACCWQAGCRLNVAIALQFFRGSRKVTSRPKLCEFSFRANYCVVLLCFISELLFLHDCVRHWFCSVILVTVRIPSINSPLLHLIFIPEIFIEPMTFFPDQQYRDNCSN